MLEDRELSEDRHRMFVTRVRQLKAVWGLRSSEGWAVAPSNDEHAEGVYPFWSDRALAGRCAVDEWSAYAPTRIGLTEFVERWLPGMQEDGFLVGTNWNSSLVGLEVLPADLAKELETDEE
ncbi:MAG: DUF2750 domain-containing protein [Planctomycetia bacterium]|nr:DUF2750 domain-containing protein [Planctomycetia bacterium]